MFNKRAQIQDRPTSPQVKLDKEGFSQDGQPTYATYGKIHYGNCLARTSGLCGCGKDDHKVRYFPTISFRGRESKEVDPNVSKDDAQNKKGFYALRTSGSKPNVDDE